MTLEINVAAAKIFATLGYAQLVREVERSAVSIYLGYQVYREFPRDSKPSSGFFRDIGITSHQDRSTLNKIYAKGPDLIRAAAKLQSRQKLECLANGFPSSSTASRVFPYHVQ